MQFPKPELKKHNRKSLHDFSAKVKKAEYEDAKGMCRICHSEPITQYHHINEKGMGGGRGLGIQINCLGVGNKCHNHDNTEFLRQADRILEERIINLFPDIREFPLYQVAAYLRMTYAEVIRQANKGFLKTYEDKTCQGYIKVWLGVA